GLKGTDVSAFPADDPALHLVTRQVENGDHRLTRLLARDALDRERDDLAGALVAFLLRASLNVTDDTHGVTLGLCLDGRDKLCLRLVRCQACHSLELCPLVDAKPV